MKRIFQKHKTQFLLPNMSISVQQRPLGNQGLQASSLGYGAMGLTAFYGPPSEDENSVGSYHDAVFTKIIMST